MRSRLLSSAMVIVGLVAISSALSGCRHRHSHDPARVKKFVTWFVDDALDDLDATEEQRQAIHASKERLLADGFTLRQEGKKVRVAMLQEWDKAEPDAERVHALIDERVEAYRSFVHEAATEALATHATLTVEQRAELSERMREHMEDR